MSAKQGNHETVIPQSLFNTNPANFNNWTVGSANTGAITRTISGDGTSVTFTRDDPADTGSYRNYIEFSFGPWANVGDRVSIIATVTGLSVDAGTPNAHMNVSTASISAVAGDAKTRVITANGTYGMMVETTVANTASFVFRIGIGTAAGDTLTNSITFSNVRVTRAHRGQTKPDPVVAYKYPRDAEIVITGDVLRNVSTTYSAATGLVSAQTYTRASGRQLNIGLAMGDSFFASSGSSYGGMMYRLARYYKQYVLYYNATGGRSLETMSNTATFLDPLWAEDGANRASWLLVTGGINDIVNNGRNDTNLLSYDQLIYNWCVSKGIYYIKYGIAPFGAHAGWTSARQGYTRDYNAALAANPFGDKFIYIPIYQSLEDSTTANNLATAYNGGDGLHPSYASSYITHAGVDEMITGFVAALGNIAAVSSGAGGIQRIPGYRI